MKKHKGLSLISSLIFVVLITFTVGEMFVFFSWSKNETIDSLKDSSRINILENEIDLGKNWLRNNELNDNPLKIEDDKLIFDEKKAKHNFSDISNMKDVKYLYIYKLSYNIGDIEGIESATVKDTLSTENDYIQKFVPPMEGKYLLRVVSNDVMIEVIVSKDPAELIEVMRQEVWY